MIKSPCKDCVDRHIGCHARCERYATYKAKNAQIKEARHVEAIKDTVDTKQRLERKKTLLERRLAGLRG